MIDEYQKFTKSTAKYRERFHSASERITYCLFGLVGETGEIAEKFKKHLRSGKKLNELMGDEDIAKELGDVAWYLTQLADELDFDLRHILRLNMMKLKSRQERGVVFGDGDNR